MLETFVARFEQTHPRDDLALKAVLVVDASVDFGDFNVGEFTVLQCDSKRGGDKLKFLFQHVS